MPYSIIKNDNKYELYLKKGNKLLGTHTTKKKAQAQIKAIEISKSGRKDPELWEQVKEEAILKLGKHSARAIQLAGKIYRELGGEYTDDLKPNQQSLKKWTNEEWMTKSGLPSSITGERYLPKKIIENLSDKEYNKTSKLKREGMEKGIQYVKQPKEIIEKIKEIKNNNSKTIKGFTYYISDKPNKKLMVKVNNKFLYFGDSKYQHYRDKTGLLPKEQNHLDPKRRLRYIMRASNIKDKEGNYTFSNPESPNYHALNILW
jgi:hypothetical protein